MAEEEEEEEEEEVGHFRDAAKKKDAHVPPICDLMSMTI
jgi:hypothetical protein